MQDTTTFDPSRYLTKVGGSDYLEVKWRLAWLRETHPDASIQTELISYSEREAVVKATVTIPDGGSASDFGSETPGDFRDYLEKASTKAIGRALAALGFGTQFSKDFDFGAEAGKVVDSPVGGSRTETRPFDGGGRPITERQLGFLGKVGREAGMSDDDVNDLAQSKYGETVKELSTSQASAMIEELQQRRAGSDLAS